LRNDVAIYAPGAACLHERLDALVHVEGELILNVTGDIGTAETEVASPRRGRGSHASGPPRSSHDLGHGDDIPIPVPDALAELATTGG